ncbi:hypothetical protein IMSAG249_01838 [Lachnospiraceae bacterium]|nr:hypothetical protein IMSAG249_01838 [Lachnospiraceae bacterium]
MATFILLLVMLILFMVLGLCFRLAGGVLKLTFQLIFCLPCAILCAVAGVVFCCTLLLIPAGIGCFKLMGWFLNPFKCCVLH